MLAPLNAFILSIAFVPGIAGAATSPRWAIASLSLFFMRAWPAVFAAYCFLMLRFDHAMHWAIVCGAFSWGLVSDEETRERVALYFACGVCISGGIAVAQYFGWNAIAQAIPPAGLFFNKNLLGEAACLALIALAGSSKTTTALRYILIAILCLSIAMTTSKSVILSTILSGSLLFSFVWPALVFSALGSLMWFVSATNHASTNERLALWSTFKPSFFGNGDWWFNVLPVDDFMHNDWLQLFHELGIVGLAPLLVLLWAFAVAPVRSHRAFIVALFTIGCFGFPLQVPATAWFAAFVCGSFLFKPSAERGVLRSSWVANV